MTIYPPKEGFTAEEMRNGQWSLYADVKCSNPDCGKAYSLANVNGIGGACKKCGWPCY